MYQNQLKNAALNLERYQRLLAKDMVSKYEVENLELSANNLKAMVDSAKADSTSKSKSVRKFKTNTNTSKSKHPMRVLSLKKHIKVGEMALSGVPTLFWQI